MKYDIAKNDEGPLRRTINTNVQIPSAGVKRAAPPDTRSSVATTSYEPTADRHPGLDERIRNIENHFAVRHGETSLQDHVGYMLIVSPSSTLAAALSPRQTASLGGSHHPPRERLSSMGSITLQSTPARCMSISVHSLPLSLTAGAPSGLRHPAKLLYSLLRPAS